MNSQTIPTKPKPAFAGPLLETGGLWLVILLIGVLLITGLLNRLQQQELQAIERAQLGLTLLEIESGLELDLSGGLDLDVNRHIPPLLENSLKKDPQLYSLDVLDVEGKTLFSTDRGTVGEQLPPAVLAAAQNAATESLTTKQQTWYGQIGGTAVMGIVLHNSFDQPSGHISATYASRSHDADRTLFTSTIIALLITAFAGIVALGLATYPQRQLLRQQSADRMLQIYSKIQLARQRLDDGSAQLDEVERIE